MEEKVTLILAELADGTRVEFSKLLAPFRERMHGVMTLLAGLELTRQREIFMRQIRPFSELWIYRREEGDRGEPEPLPEPVDEPLLELEDGAPEQPQEDAE